jgi:hypothetical protein
MAFRMEPVPTQGIELLGLQWPVDVGEQVIGIAGAMRAAQENSIIETVEGDHFYGPRKPIAPKPASAIAIVPAIQYTPQSAGGLLECFQEFACASRF